MKFTPIPADFASSMDRQRAFVGSLVADAFPGTRLSQSQDDFAVLQAIVDRTLLGAEQTWELQALGVCFGDALLAYIPGLHWSLVTDEYGTDPTLRFKETTIQFNALTVISKWVEDGREVDVLHMAEWLLDFIQKESPEFGNV